MGKRIVRLLPSEIAAKTPELIGREAHIVLRNGTTLRGRVQAISAIEIHVTDSNSRWYNARKHLHIVPMTEVAELQTEYSAAW